MISIWKPLKGPLSDWPLTFCDASTIQKDMDLEPADLLYPNLATENFQVYHRAEQKWYYLSNQTPGELIVFKQADSLIGTDPGIHYHLRLTVHILTQNRRTALLLLQPTCLTLGSSSGEH